MKNIFEIILRFTAKKTELIGSADARLWRPKTKEKSGVSLSPVLLSGLVFGRA